MLPHTPESSSLESLISRYISVLKLAKSELARCWSASDLTRAIQVSKSVEESVRSNSCPENLANVLKSVLKSKYIPNPPNLSDIQNAHRFLLCTFLTNLHLSESLYSIVFDEYIRSYDVQEFVKDVNKMTIPMIALDSSFEVLTMLRQCMDNAEGNRCSTETHHNFRIFGNSQEHAPRAVASRTAAKLLLRCLSDSSMQEVNINTGHESDNCDYNMTRVKDILQRLQKYSHEVPATLVILAETLLLTSSHSEVLSATSSENYKGPKYIRILQSHLIDTITSILSSSLDSYSSNPTSDVPLWHSHRHLLCKMTLEHPPLRNYHGNILAKVIEKLVHITSATSGSHPNDESKIEKVEDELNTIEIHLTSLVNLCTHSPSLHNTERNLNPTTEREVRELIAGWLESWWDSIVIERWKILKSPKKEEFEKLWGEWFEKVGALAANDG